MKRSQHDPILHSQQSLDIKINMIAKRGVIPGLLLHSCCSPCSSYVLEYLSQYFSVTVFFYNPNIHPEEEYYKRLEEQKKLIVQLPVNNKIHLIEGEYEPDVFFKETQGLEQEKEGGKRCLRCFYLRLKKTAEKASDLKFPYFTTTLTVSPHKNAEIINQIGQEIAFEYHLDYLYSNFKKKNGFKRSIALSHQYHLYRQNYCGCIYSIKNKN